MLNFKTILLSLLLFWTHTALADTAPTRPNVLFIAIDDLRDWVGYEKRNPQTITPNIDRLAARGVAFTRAYCAAPVCNPSRAALMTGFRPSSSGVYENGNDWRTVVPVAQTLTSAFRTSGYYVAGSGKIYHESFARRAEWDDYLDNDGRDPLPNGDTGVGGIRFAPLNCRDEDMRDHRIVDYAISQLSKSHDKPFFLACGIHKPHMPWNVPQKYFDLHPLSSIQLPPTLATDLEDIPPAGIRMAKPDGDHAKIVESGRWKEAVQAYLASISFTDFQIGRLLDALDKSAYRDKTIVVLWGDHGWHLGEKQHWRKFALWEESTRAPLIWIAPGVTKSGGISTRTVDFMSIFPTLTDLCGIPTPAHVEGKSIRSLLANPSGEWNQPALTTYRFNNHAVRSEAYRYIRYANGDEELYDESADPNEWNNLALKPHLSAVKSALAQYFPQTNQPDIGHRNANESAESRRERRQRRAQGPSTQPTTQPVNEE